MATDKRLDQVSTLTDFDYALIVKGDQVAKASKQQLAELVGNLLYGATNASSLATVVAGNMRKTLTAGYDIDGVKTNGSYYISRGINTPGDFFSFDVIKSSSTDVIQVGYCITYDYLYKRTYINGIWSVWRKVSFS